MTTEKTPVDEPTTVEPDDLDHEVGKRLVIRHKGEDFSIADIAHDRPWRQVMTLLAGASGELGVSQIEPAMLQIVGEDQLAKTDDWVFADFMHFSQKVGERIGASVGTPGESRGSRR